MRMSRSLLLVVIFIVTNAMAQSPGILHDEREGHLADVRQMTFGGENAEATICPKDGSIIFSSTRDGDLELYRMDADGSNVKRLTDAPGYDGGAFYSSDCSKIVWRASRPTGWQHNSKRLASSPRARTALTASGSMPLSRSSKDPQHR